MQVVITKYLLEHIINEFAFYVHDTFKYWEIVNRIPDSE